MEWQGDYMGPVAKTEIPQTLNARKAFLKDVCDVYAVWRLDRKNVNRTGTDKPTYKHKVQFACLIKDKFCVVAESDIDVDTTEFGGGREWKAKALEHWLKHNKDAVRESLVKKGLTADTEDDMASSSPEATARRAAAFTRHDVVNDSVLQAMGRDIQEAAGFTMPVPIRIVEGMLKFARTLRVSAWIDPFYTEWVMVTGQAIPVPKIIPNNRTNNDSSESSESDSQPPKKKQKILPSLFRDADTPDRVRETLLEAQSVAIIVDLEQSGDEMEE
ncbi:hypothetical protein P153DRAFT_414392 [Dothidotthia symphoricarpi CBS 119687]|uniref:Uncharacterized protein n=1 Tax=Dothidotthia symphoricarpi CBS 119687 TaxID=1392245 RepID=A0A6A6ALR0_9PLEO|nr:uncharacterized protein P153DRAFT_414392 [Dothidotthia symphoricarpi CBS 119687]KAF2132740.1 hypothetical protein P153DRAFT_414392 [Dothidotthia symphoricarpi CBS 119687]